MTTPMTEMHPGNPKAREAGCRCPQETNEGGHGIHAPAGADANIAHYVVAENCPMHGKGTWKVS